MSHISLSKLAYRRQPKVNWRRWLKKIIRALHLMRVASWSYELYRLIKKPHTFGALVAIWQNNELLMVETSYRPGYGLPGGGLLPGESAREAAVRELAEEVGLLIESSWLEEPWTITEQKPGGLNTVTIFSLYFSKYKKNGDSGSEKLTIEIDQLEIVSTSWMSRKQALKQHIPKHLRQYLIEKYL